MTIDKLQSLLDQLILGVAEQTSYEVVKDVIKFDVALPNGKSLIDIISRYGKDNAEIRTEIINLFESRQ